MRFRFCVEFSACASSISDLVASLAASGDFHSPNPTLNRNFWHYNLAQISPELATFRNRASPVHSPWFFEGVSELQDSEEAMLYVVGLGLGDEKDITVRGLEAVRRCDKVYLEAYTSLLALGLGPDATATLVRPSLRAGMQEWRCFSVVF